MEMNAFSFFDMEPFTGAPRGEKPRFYVTVSGDRIGFPQGFFRLMGEPENVEFYFDGARKLFAVKPVSAPTKWSKALYRCDGMAGRVYADTGIVRKLAELRDFTPAKNNLVLTSYKRSEEFGFVFDLDEGEVVERRHRVQRSR